MISAVGPPVNPRSQLCPLPYFCYCLAGRLQAEFAARMSPTTARWTTVAIGVAAACALAFSTQQPWWQEGEFEVFLTRTLRCDETGCQSIAGMSWLGQDSLWWHRYITATFGVGLLAGFLALFVAGARAAGRHPRTASGSLLVSVVTALVCAALSLLAVPTMLQSMELGLGSPLYAGGLVLSAVAAVLARRAHAPSATPPVPGEPAPEPAPGPAATPAGPAKS